MRSPKLQTLLVGSILVLVMGFSALLISADASFAADEGVSCGGIVGPSVCSEGEFCDPLPEMCGEDNPLGTCVKKYENCTEGIIEVCGCDGKTYSSDCKRRQAEQQKKADGKCAKY
ncbi:MAG: Kazal domain-containing protein [Candidatus Dadabacteria bacterium]|nr:Kazal domain-containing protein [Candidatus Dadabacteria bacterium]